MAGSSADMTFPCTACLIEFKERIVPGQRIETLSCPLNLKTAQAKFAFHFYAEEDFANSSLVTRQLFVASCTGIVEALGALQPKTAALSPRMYERYIKLPGLYEYFGTRTALLPTPPLVPSRPHRGAVRTAVWKTRSLFGLRFVSCGAVRSIMAI